MKNFIKNNIKVVTAFIIGGVIFGGTTLVLAAVGANQVTYTNNGQSTVQGALDTLYTKANNMVPIDPDTFQTNSANTVYASSKGVCIKRNDKLNCFKINNWTEEQNHIQQVFSDINCDVDDMRVNCYASDFDCDVFSDGYVSCRDCYDFSRCFVNSDGSVNCN